MKLRVDTCLSQMTLLLLMACGGPGPVREVSQAPIGGPAGDYPIVIGPPYSVGGESFTPIDVMNYDAVGRAIVSRPGGTSITVGHHTLPLPSYVEITALDSGKTILARVERRGPMASRDLIELSPGAAQQLGVTPGSRWAVRVRRVNPIEAERALLRSGQVAPDRMDTPKTLLAVLMRKLEQLERRTPASSAPIKAAPAASPVPSPTSPRRAGAASAHEGDATEKATEKAASASPAAAQGRLVIQLAAYGDKRRAEALAAKVGGFLARAGEIWRVRLGPYASQAEADKALAKLRGAGYAEARIQHAN